MSYPMPRDDLFKALADPVRREILVGLGDGPSPVHAIAERFDVSRPAISKHLRVLTEAGLVSAQRSGKENLYALNNEALGEVVEWLNRMWAGRLGLLKQIAERST